MATVAIGNAANAGLLAVRMLGTGDRELRVKMAKYMKTQEDEVPRKSMQAVRILLHCNRDVLKQVLQKASKLEEVGYCKYMSDEMK